MTLMQMVMEASRIKDEKRVSLEDAEPKKKNKKIAKKEDLSVLADLLNPLKEVESYIIADENGDVHLASPENYNEEVLNLSIYLWVIGDKTGEEGSKQAANSMLPAFESGIPVSSSVRIPAR